MKKQLLLLSLFLISTCLFSQNQTNAYENLKKRSKSVVKLKSATITDIEGNIYHTIKIGTQTWMFENLRTTKYNDGTKIDCVEKLTTEKYENGSLIQSTNNLGSISIGRYYKFNQTLRDGIYISTIAKGVLYNYAAMSSDKLCPIGWHVPTDNDWLIFIKIFCELNDYNWNVKLTDLGRNKFADEFNGNYVCSSSSGGGLFFTSPDHAGSKGGGHLWSFSGKYLYYLSDESTMGIGFQLGLDYNHSKDAKYESFCVRCIKD